MSTARRALLAGALAALALAAPTLAARAHAARVYCRGHGSSTIAANSHARLFTAANGNDYACLYSVGRAFYLSTAEHYQYELVHFAGAYVAYVQNVEAIDDNVSVMDLRDGRAHSYAIVPPIDNQLCPTVGSVALKADGAVAWIGTNFFGEGCSNPPGPVIEVRSHDRHGLHVLDNSTAIDPGSLRLHGSTLSWTHGGATRTATLS